MTLALEEIQGKFFMLMINNETFIVWDDEEYSFMLQCNRTEDADKVLIEIAETIK